MTACVKKKNTFEKWGGHKRDFEKCFDMSPVPSGNYAHDHTGSIEEEDAQWFMGSREARF